MTKQAVYKQLSSLVFGACVMSMMASCGGSSSSSSGHSGKQGNPIREQELGTEGRYVAQLNPMNSSVAGVVNAVAKIQVVGDQIAVTVDMKDSPSRTMHSQFIYTANECPTDAHDSNSDGFIDPIEASKVLGKILIPLDSGLNTQADGANEFPTSNSMGNYHYYKEGVLSEMVADLQSPDLDPKDELGKLNAGEALKLEGKVVVIQGISNDVYLPGSIATFEGVSDRASLAIACGKIQRVMIDESETTGEDATID